MSRVPNLRMRGAPRRWSPGDRVVLRFVGHDDGVVQGWPQIVVEDAAERVVLFQPAGVIVVNRRTDAPDVRSDHISRGEPGNFGQLPASYVPEIDVVRIIPAAGEHAVEVYLADDDRIEDRRWWLATAGRLRGWKVNLQAPVRRTRFGFDTTDNVLDVVVARDRSWQWKDGDQLARRVEAGLATADEAVRFRAEGERVIEQIERGDWPFIDQWEHWQPDPAWRLPALPDGWDSVPGYDADLNRVRLPDEL